MKHLKKTSMKSFFKENDNMKLNIKNLLINNEFFNFKIKIKNKNN